MADNPPGVLQPEMPVNFGSLIVLAFLLLVSCPAQLLKRERNPAPKLARTGKRDLYGAIRVFLRYCYRQQVIGKDLSGAVECRK